MSNKNLHNHISGILKQGTRLDNRKLTEYREPIKAETGVVNTADGSARVMIGETEVIAGVKMEVSTPYPDTPDKGTIIVGAELLPLSNPNFELGPPGIQAIELARVVDRGIRESGALDFKKMCIKEGEKVWTALIDICTINDSGNLLDASSLAALAALKDTTLPKFDGEKIIPKEKTKDKLPLNDSDPLAITVIKIGNSLIIDPTNEEEKVVDARLSVCSMKDGTLCALQKGGDIPLTPEEVIQMIDIAVEKANELRGHL